MLRYVVNRANGERLTVELEIGPQLWVRDQQGAIESVSREHLPAERWAFIECGASNVDLS
jgi:hypothetical protein